MNSLQNAREYATDQLKQGKLTVAEANVLMIQLEGVRIVSNKLPLAVRKALNAAVKAGELGHIKKEGLKPEVYHHKNARPRALEIREREMRNKIASLSKVYSGDPLF